MRSSSKIETHTFRVGVTTKGRRLEFMVKATTGTKAVSEARLKAKDEGIPRIIVNYVRPVNDTVFRYVPDYEDAPTELGGTYNPTDFQSLHAGQTPSSEVPTISLEETKKLIKIMWERLVVFVPKQELPPLIAYQQGDLLFLDDGISGRVEVSNSSIIDLVILFFDWATYTGWCSEDFDDFLGMCWN